jgi:hypothetical protein
VYNWDDLKGACVEVSFSKYNTGDEGFGLKNNQ